MDAWDKSEGFWQRSVWRVTLLWRTSFTFWSMWISKRSTISLLLSRVQHFVAGIERLWSERRTCAAWKGGNCWSSATTYGIQWMWCVFTRDIASHTSARRRFCCFYLFSESKALTLKARMQHPMSFLLPCFCVNCKQQKDVIATG